MRIHFKLRLKSQCRDNVSVPVSAHSHRAWWRCLWRARSVVCVEVQLEDLAGLVHPLCNGIQDSFSQDPFPAHISQASLLSRLHYSEAAFLLLGDLPAIILSKLFTSLHLQALKSMVGSRENRKFQCNSQRLCAGLKPKTIVCLFWPM